jgi:hypothetical protein
MRYSPDQLATLLEAQLRLDEAHNKDTVAQHGRTVPRGVKPADLETWRRDQRKTAATELHDASEYMQRCLRKFNVSENYWRRKLRKDAEKMINVP